MSDGGGQPHIVVTSKKLADVQKTPNVWRFNMKMVKSLLLTEGAGLGISREGNGGYHDPFHGIDGAGFGITGEGWNIIKEIGG